MQLLNQPWQSFLRFPQQSYIFIYLDSNYFQMLLKS